MANDDYTLLPEKEFLKVKHDVEAIKKNPLSGLGGEDLIASINELKNSINSLLELFKTAADEVKLEQRESETIAQKLDPLFSKLDELSEQNKKIAKGIVAIADLLSEIKTKPEIKPTPAMPTPQATPITPKPIQPRLPPLGASPRIPPIPTAVPAPGMPSHTIMPKPLPPPPAPTGQKKKWLF